MKRKARKDAPNAALKEAPPTADTEWFNFKHSSLGVNRIVDAEAGRVDLFMPGTEEPRRKFAIIGFASSSRHLAPLDDPEWVVAGMNQLQRHLLHAAVDEDGKPIVSDKGTAVPVLRHGDLWFEIHEEWNTAIVEGTDHEGWLKECKIPCYMTRLHPGLPHAVRYPVERLIEKFDIDYFTSTPAYMFAWAVDHIDRLVEDRLKEMPRNGESAVDILKLVRSLYAEYTIGVFGIDLIVGDEYFNERPAAEFWLGQAMARNITLMIPEQSALLKQRFRYGYEMEPADLLHENDLAKRREGHQGTHDRASHKAAELYGRLGELDGWPKDEEQLKERLEKLTAEHQKASKEAVMADGALEELDYLEKLRCLRERGGEVG